MRIIIIGCGAITESFYLPSIKKFPDILKSLILIDKDEPRLNLLSENYNISDCDIDYKKYIDQVDGVIVAVPNNLHYKISMDFLSKGVHVLCEKPLAESYEEAEDMVKTAENNGVALCVNNTRRLFPSYIKVKELIDNKVIGELEKIQYFEGGKFSWPTSSGFYFNNKGSPKGILLDRGAHVLDLICWWLSAKPDIESSQNDSFGGTEAVVDIKFKYENCYGELKLSWLNKLKNIFFLQGTKGKIQGDIYNWRKLSLYRNNGLNEEIILKTDVRYFSDFGDKIVKNFVNVINGIEEPLVPGDHILNSIRFFDESYKNAKRFKMPWYENG
ncbi:MAG: Gfo/Idh/MocA family protein [Candidatus Helarchaeota archaeon]